MYEGASAEVVEEGDVGGDEVGFTDEVGEGLRAQATSVGVTQRNRRSREETHVGIEEEKEIELVTGFVEVVDTSEVVLIEVRERVVIEAEDRVVEVGPETNEVLNVGTVEFDPP